MFGLFFIAAMAEDDLRRGPLEEGPGMGWISMTFGRCWDCFVGWVDSPLVFLGLPLEMDGWVAVGVGGGSGAVGAAVATTDTLREVSFACSFACLRSNCSSILRFSCRLRALVGSRSILGG